MRNGQLSFNPIDSVIGYSCANDTRLVMSMMKYTRIKKAVPSFGGERGKEKLKRIFF